MYISDTYKRSSIGVIPSNIGRRQHPPYIVQYILNMTIQIGGQWPQS